ncbi:ABC transporter ATP-binding protein [Nocardiopsis potens]|uniref:ABC transporter ATP-binding protein n=1 Tax=Nocardiopsis potens TaxID=1246458 RepID=UPI0012685958|nr:ABC transporter ATP-binding protein [Nocardiopsis potens]
MLKRMAPRFRGHRWHVLGLAVLVLLNVGLGVAAPLLLLQIVDRALPQRDAVLLAWLCGGLVGAGLLAGVVSCLQAVLSAWIGQQVLARLRRDVYDAVAPQPPAFFGRGHAEIQSRMVSDIGSIERLITSTAQTFLTAAATLVGFFTIMLFLSRPLALVSLASAFLLSLLNNRFAVRRRDLSRRRQESLAAMTKHLGEDMSAPGRILARTMLQEGAQRSRFTACCDTLRQVSVRQAAVGAVATGTIAAAFACVPPLIYWIGGTYFPELTIGTILVLVIMQMRLSDPIRSLLKISGSLQVSAAVFERVFDHLDLPRHEPGGGRAAAPPGPAPSVEVRVESHAYPGRGLPVVADVDLRIEPGGSAALTGPSGSGKSTLGLIAAGLIPPGSGEVGIDGVPCPPEALRRIATLVPQEPVLFDRSLRENLAFGAPGASDADIERAVRSVGLGHLVDSLELGLDTPVGDGGRALSGGERQRLALARALLDDCRVLVVDEPTSSLDAATAAQVLEALHRAAAGRTLLLITHRESEADSCDRVFSLEGRAAAPGARGACSGGPAE